MSETGSQASATTVKRAVRGYKIVVLGDGGVGKSALTMQFVCHQFLDYHDPTIEDVYQHQARIDGEPAQLEILDTAGQPEFTAMREQYMRAGEGFVVCYSVIARRSFDEALEYKKLIDRVRTADTTPYSPRRKQVRPRTSTQGEHGGRTRSRQPMGLSILRDVGSTARVRR
ncbi:GTP-binding protein Rit2 [Lamellibrachia satsuma]|nr:GTP-binding protein Rit2 [Lamellibrachia satsuma]